MLRFGLLILIFSFFTMESIAQIEPVGPMRNKSRRDNLKNQVEIFPADENIMAGKWLEFKRAKMDGKREMLIPFTDSIKVEFNEDSSSMFFLADGKLISDFCSLKDGLFTIGNGYVYDNYKIEVNSIRLGLDGVYSYFKKVNNFYFAPIQKVIPGVEVADDIQSVSKEFIMGEWKVYKKEDPQFSRSKTYLRNMAIGPLNTTGAHELAAFMDESGKLIEYGGTLTIAENTLQMALEKETKSFSILKAEGDELTLQDGQIIYFVKKLSK